VGIPDLQLSVVGDAVVAWNTFCAGGVIGRGEWGEISPRQKTETGSTQEA